MSEENGLISYRSIIENGTVTSTVVILEKYYKQLQAAKEENEKLTQQNKQMMGLISEINSEYSDDGILSKATKYAIQQALKGVE